MLAVPFVIYWLILKDFFHNIDICDNSIDTGYCLSDSECATIVNGTNIGSCESEATGSTCCKITLNYFNETYSLNPLFVRKSQTDTGVKMVLFNTNTHSRFKIQYGNKSISSDRKLKTIIYDPKVHNCEAPDKIMWPIMASYSRRRNSSRIVQLYVATLEKLDSDEEGERPSLPGCSSESSIPDDKFILLLNPQETFPLRNYVTAETRNQSSKNFTFDVKRLSDKTKLPPTRSRRSAFHAMLKQEDDSTCKKQQREDMNDALEEEDIGQIVFSQYENNQDIHERKESHIKIKDIVQIHDYVLGSEYMLRQLIKMKTGYEEPIIDEERGKTSLNISSLAKQIDSNLKNVEDFEENVGFSRSSPLKTVAAKETSDFKKVDKDIQRDYINGMTSGESEPTRNLKEHKQIKAKGDFQKRIQTSHDLREPVKIEATHDMRKPVLSDESHDLRWPVLEEETHDMRKPVILDESHDLRLPVLEEGETGPRFIRESSIVKNIRSGKTIDSEKRDAGILVLKKDNEKQTFQDFSSYCKMNVSFNFKNKSLESSFEDQINQKWNKLDDLWKEALTVCGKHPEYTEDASDSEIKENWPWMVSLQESFSGKFSHKCSASLLNSRWVITVAHCVDMKPISNFKLVLKNESGDGDYTKMALDEVIIHPKFNRGMLENDLALLRLATPVKFQPNLFPVCLPPSIADLKNGTSVLLGWELKYQQLYDDSRKATGPVMTNYECEVLYSTSKNKEKIKDTFMCVGKNDGNCDAESGSSLTMLDSEGRWSVIGLVSWGSMCSNPEQPGVYIRISSYSQWIKDVIDCYEILV